MMVLNRNLDAFGVEVALAIRTSVASLKSLGEQLNAEKFEGTKVGERTSYI